MSFGTSVSPNINAYINAAQLALDISGNFLTNPLSTDIDCLNLYKLQGATEVDAATVRTDTLTAQLGSSNIQVDDDIVFNGSVSFTLSSNAQSNVIGYDPITKAVSYQAAGGGGGGVQNPMTSNLDCGNYSVSNADTFNGSNIQTESLSVKPGSLQTALSVNDPLNMVSGYSNDVYMNDNRLLFTHNSSAPPPNYWSINGYYNIDTGTLPLPVWRFNAAKAGGTQNKSHSLYLSDGVAIYRTEWEGNFPTTLSFVQNSFNIANSGLNSQLNATTDFFTIAPNSVAATTVNLTGTLNASLDVVSATSNSLNTTAALAQFRQSNTWFVAKNGNDGTGNGSEAKPYLTIQAAVNAAQAGALPSAGNQAIIYVAPGVYTETVTMVDGYTTIKGGATHPNYSSGITRIVGKVVITATGADDLYNRVFGLDGLTIIATGANIAIEDNTTTTQHSVIVNNCRIEADNRAVYLHSAVTDDTRNTFFNCIIAQSGNSLGSTDPLFQIDSGWLTLTLCELVAANTQSDVINFAGTSYPYRIGLTTFLSTSTSPTANPICRLKTTQTGLASFGQCGFTYLSATAKTSPTSTGILFDGGGSFVYPATPVAQFLQNTFLLTGMNTSQDAICKSVGTGTPIIFTYMNGAAPTTADGIQGSGAIIHSPYNTVS